jgi:hypothetical protein
MSNETAIKEESRIHHVPISTLYTSPTVSMLADDEKPQAENICAHCLNANWFTTVVETKCFCIGMRVIVWETNKPIAITRCDKFMDSMPEKD